MTKTQVVLMSEITPEGQSSEGLRNRLQGIFYDTVRTFS